MAIARALVSHPRMVLADEPTAALDSQSGRNIVELMQKLAREQGCTILIVTGLSSFLTDIELYFDDRNAKLLTIKGNMTAVSNWSMYHFVPANNYLAAIIVDTQISKQQINFWNWEQR